MAHHQELTLVKALADAVVQRNYGVDFNKVKAHSNFHGNEVADRIANLAAKAQVDVETEGVHHLTDTESAYPQGI
jgi:ribonuclease HI